MIYLQSGNRNLIVGLKLLLGRQYPCQPLLPATPKILNIVISSSRQKSGYSGPLVPQLSLQFYHDPLFLHCKPAPTIHIPNKT